MSVVGLDPVAAPGVAGELDRAAEALEAQARRIAALVDAAGLAGGAPGAVVGVAGDLRAGADDLRRRAGELADDVDRLVREVVAFVGGDALSLWNGGPSDAMPWGTWLAGAVREQRLVRFLRGGGVVSRTNPLPLFNNGLVGRGLQRLPAMGWLGRPAATTVLRRAGIAGGLYTGVTGTGDLVRQGDPVDAYRRGGAGYVADVAGTAFGYSSAAFLACPTPVTGAVLLGTGAVWLGAEAWDHREDIAEAWDGATGWVGDRVDDVGDAMTFWN